MQSKLSLNKVVRGRILEAVGSKFLVLLAPDQKTKPVLKQLSTGTVFVCSRRAADMEGSVAWKDVGLTTVLSYDPRMCSKEASERLRDAGLWESYLIVQTPNTDPTENRIVRIDRSTILTDPTESNYLNSITIKPRR